MTEIDWIERDVSTVRQGMRIAPLASWTLDVHEVTPNGWVVFNHDTRRAFLYDHPRGTVHVLHHNAQPALGYDKVRINAAGGTL